MNELNGEFNCETCHFGKETRKPFPTTENKRDTKPGEMLHVDLSGKMSTVSLGGSSYFLLIKDEATGFATAYFLKNKNVAAKSIIDFVAMIEKQTGNTLKTIRSDNGTEFVNQELDTYGTTRGIIPERTVPHCPESNGKIEREMRTVKSLAKTMLLQFDTPEFLWAEAIACTLYVRNRLLNKQSFGKTPFEHIFGRKPNLKHLKLFGCAAYEFIPKAQRGQWKSNSRKLMLVGYQSTSRHYRLYDPETRKIIIGRNTSFQENINPRARFVIGGKNAQDKGVPDQAEDENNDNPDPQPESDEEAEANKENYRVLVQTENGEIEMDLPEGQVELTLQRLRDRKNLKKPDRFMGGFVNAAVELPTMAEIEPQNYKQALASPYAAQWKEAMDAEYASLLQNQTWILVPRPQHARVLDARWLYKIKRESDGSIARFKARLVIKGYKQIYGLDYNETFASVCRFESVRLLFAIAASEKLHILQFDVKTAFLNGELDEEIFMVQPEGYGIDIGQVCLLLRILYGLK